MYEPSVPVVYVPVAEIVKPAAEAVKYLTTTRPDPPLPPGLVFGADPPPPPPKFAVPSEPFALEPPVPALVPPAAPVVVPPPPPPEP